MLLKWFASMYNDDYLTVKDVPTAAPLTFPNKIIAAMTPEFKPNEQI